MKLIKPLTCLLLILIFSGCSPSADEQYQRKWRNDLAERTINGVKNPYMIDEYIYIYSAKDRSADPEDSPKHLCFYRIYTLNEDAKRQDDLLSYLQNLTQLESQSIKTEGQKTTSVWMPLSEIQPEFFNPFSNDKFRYNRFEECQEFLAVNQPVATTDFVDNYHLRFMEEYRVTDEDALNMKAQFSQVVINPDTLVSLKLWCRSNYIYFYDVKRDYFLMLDFSVPERSHNPNCQ